MKKTKDSSRDSSLSTRIVLRENSSINTKELTDSQVEEWVRAILKIIRENSLNSDFSYDIWLGSNQLSYINLESKGDIVSKYRVNDCGQLERNERGNWYVVSNIFIS